MTELTVYTRNDFLALSEESEVSAAMAANALEGDSMGMFDLVRVKVPSSGGLFWNVADEMIKEIVGVIVFQHMSGALWESDDPQAGVPPILSTNDLKYAKLQRSVEQVPAAMLEELVKHELPVASVQAIYPMVAEEDLPRIFRWKELPYTQFGSGKKGFGKFAKESRVLYILRQGELWPIVIRIPGGSLNNLKNFMMRDLKVAHWRAVIGLTLREETSKGGQLYSQVVPNLKGSLSIEEGELINQKYRLGLEQSFTEGKLDVIDDAE